MLLLSYLEILFRFGVLDEKYRHDKGRSDSRKKGKFN